MTLSAAPFRFQELPESAHNSAGIGQFALPYDKCLPACGSKELTITGVPPTIPFDFWCPVAGVRLGLIAAPTALMSVPETTVNENRFSCSNKRYVGFAGQITPVQAVTSANTGYQLAHCQFWGSVFRLDPRHVPAALGSCQCIQGIKPCATRVATSSISGTSPRPSQALGDACNREEV